MTVFHEKKKQTQIFNFIHVDGNNACVESEKHEIIFVISSYATLILRVNHKSNIFLNYYYILF